MIFSKNSPFSILNSPLINATFVKNLTMIAKDTLSFLNDLKNNNNRDWFHASKKRYEKAKQNIIDVTAFLTSEIGKFDNDIQAFDPKKGLFRIARDVRFSNDKTPYKTNFGTCISSKGKNIYNYSTYYLHVDPEQSFFSSGVYMPDKDYLNLVRNAIYYDFPSFEAIVRNKDFVAKFGELAEEPEMKKLTRVPNNFDKNSPAAEYLKYKNFYVFVNISTESLMDENLFTKEVLSAAKLMKPFNDFFNHTVVENA